MNVRPARATDIPAIAEVIVSAWQAAYRGILPDEWLDAMSIPRIEESWIGGLQDETYKVLVVEADGCARGFVGFGAARGDDLDPDRVGELYAIYVHPEWWGRGAGRALLSEALAALRERGYAHVVLWTMRDNARARRFYERAGLVWDGATQESSRGSTAFTEVRYGQDL
jgi:ribosomal protein S18 acetylase RimI-like enzyme